METLKLAQLYKYYHSSSKEKKNELLAKVKIDYCIPDTLLGKQRIRSQAGCTILHFAVLVEDLDLIIELLAKGASLTRQSTEDGDSPLHTAMISLPGHLVGRLPDYSLISTLLSNQVKVNNTLNPKCKKGMSHLHIACAVNHAGAVEFFAKAKEPLNETINNDADWLPGYTPLHFAVRYSSIEAVDVLLRYDVDLHVKNAKGMSCVHLLVQRIMDMTDIITMGKRTLCSPYEDEIKRLESIIMLVLKARAKDEIFVDDTGLSALHVASTLTDKSVVEDFLKKNVDINMPVKNDSKFWPGWTPLHFAACFSTEVMGLLMQNGADIMIKNLKGETALDLFAKRFTPADILTMDNEFKDIVLSDNCVKLSDLLLVLNDCEKFSGFLQNLNDVNVVIPSNSRIWPGYNLLHLSVSLSEKTKVLHETLGSPGTADSNGTLKRFNCTKDEVALYNERIELCLKFGCSVDVKNANGQTPIHLAFDMSKGAVVKQLLSGSQDNVVDQKGLSHLLIACMLGDPDAVKRYVSGGADVNSQVKSSFEWLHGFPENIRVNSTPLHLAVRFGHRDIVEYLLDSNADVYAKDSLGLTPIHLVTANMSLIFDQTRDLQLAELLFKATPNLRDSVSAANLSHLHVAAWANDQEAVDQLLLNGAQVDRCIEATAEQFALDDQWVGQTALCVAMALNSEKAVEALLKGGAKEKFLNRVDPFRCSMKKRLTEESSKRYVRMLKSGQCNVESTRMTLLHVACGNCDVEWAERLLRDGADVNARIHRDGERESVYDGATPLYVLIHEALEAFEYQGDFLDPRNVFDLVELLVNSGADVTIECRGLTPVHLIHMAVPYGTRGNITHMLLRAGDLLLRSQKFHDVNPSNVDGFSHFHFACVRNDVETARKFLDRGVDVNESADPFALEIRGFTPLHFATAHGSREIVQLLLERGADVNVEDTDGNKPLHVAMEKNLIGLQIMETMISHGADIYAKNMKDETPLNCLLCTFISTLTRENYLDIIELFMDNGYDLDQQDTKYGSLLLGAIYYHNLEGINALLQLGTDINMINSPLFEDIFVSASYPEGIEVLACHLWKMRLIKLKLNESSLRCLATFENQYAFGTLFEQSCQHELTKVKQTAICEGLVVMDFLSELGAVAQYPRMGHIQRTIVNKYFKSTVDIRREFPEFCGFLAFQYKKALARMELWQPAKEAVLLICQVELPDLCLEAILRYFTNNEMKCLVDIKEDFIQ